ncbi:MAG: ABC transporter permease [Anaerolineales bacterium]|nr:ABC transporter permease [Anaerolineales bacterium]
MIRNSEVNHPNYNLIQHSKLAWTDTKEYLSNAIRGNFGYIETQYGLVRVKTILKETYINSMGLLLVALAIAIIIGLYAGAFATLTRHKKIVLPILLLTIFGISAPSFFAGLMLRQGEIYYLRTFGKPLVNVAGFGWDYKHMLLPVLVLAARPLAYLARASFIAFGRIMDEDFIRTAYSKGLDKRSTVNVHAIRNIAIPVLTAIGVSLRFSLSTLPIVEFFFVWPGMGLRLLEAIDLRQTTLVVTLALALGLTFLALNLFLDISYRFIDPRVREIQ